MLETVDLHLDDGGGRRKLGSPLGSVSYVHDLLVLVASSCTDGNIHNQVHFFQLNSGYVQ